MELCTKLATFLRPQLADVDDAPAAFDPLTAFGTPTFYFESLPIGSARSACYSDSLGGTPTTSGGLVAAMAGLSNSINATGEITRFPSLFNLGIRFNLSGNERALALPIQSLMPPYTAAFTGRYGDSTGVYAMKDNANSNCLLCLQADGTLAFNSDSNEVVTTSTAVSNGNFLAILSVAANGSGAAYLTGQSAYTFIAGTVSGSFKVDTFGYDEMGTGNRLSSWGLWPVALTSDDVANYRTWCAAQTWGSE